ncbi:MAG: hypothetical protein HMLKMBBP_00186 [Planctomycetes bacterium]|nr:hypothetical protein [Planctomycetota bacterium]
MHGAVLQNEDYISFSNENTVEVLALGRLDEGIQKNDPRAAEYDAKDADGKPVKYMVSWPGLTKEEIFALNSSKAGSYNNTGGIPFTCVVNPHDEKEMQRWQGGQSAKTIMEAVATHKKTINAQFGPSLSRGTIKKIEEEGKKIAASLEKGNLAAAAADLKKLQKSVSGKDGKVPEGLKPRLGKVEDALVEAIGKVLDEAEGLIGTGDAAGAKKSLAKVAAAAKGTSAEARVKELEAKIKEMAPAEPAK